MIFTLPRFSGICADALPTEPSWQSISNRRLIIKYTQAFRTIDCYCHALRDEKVKEHLSGRRGLTSATSLSKPMRLSYKILCKGTAVNPAQSGLFLYSGVLTSPAILPVLI